MRSMMRRGTSLQRSTFGGFTGATGESLRGVSFLGTYSRRGTRPRHESSGLGFRCVVGALGVDGVDGRLTRSRQSRLVSPRSLFAGGGARRVGSPRLTTPSRPVSGESLRGAMRPSIVPGVPGEGIPEPAGKERAG